METRRYPYGTGVLRRAVALLTILTFLFAGYVSPVAADDITVQIGEGETRSNDGGLHWKNGKLTIMNSGVVEATGPEVVHGVSVENGGLNVTNNENARITGKVNGVVTSGTSSGARIENKTGATIEGGEFGVMFLDTGGAVVNSGNITGGVYAGVYSAYETSVTNDKGGSIAGGETGVDVRIGSVTNSGTVTGGSHGVRALTVTNRTGGVIAGREGSGVRLTDGGTVTNDAGGSIAGDRNGITMGYGTVTNTGTIGEVKDGTGTTTVASKDGITIGNYSSDQTAKVTNAYDAATDMGGKITGTRYGIHVTSGEANIANEKKATITGGESGIYHEGTGTITNTGTITGQQTGATLTGAATVRNSGGGTIAGAESGITMNYGTVTNTGTIGEVKDSTGAITVASKYGVAVNNTSADQTARVTNAYDSATGTGGKITGTIYGIHAEGVNVNVANQAKATITGGESGIYHEGTGTITNAGTITGQQTGVTLTGAATATNTGVIEGKKKYGVEMKNSGATLKNQAGGTITGEEVGVYVGAGAFRENAGTVTGGQYGVYYEGANELSNTGTVTATKGTAVMFTGAGTVVNSGTIKGSSTASATEGVTASGIKVTGKADITNSAGGSIAGADSGITMNYGTVTNTGTIGEVKDSTGATTVASKYGILIENFYQDRAASIVNSYNPDPYPPGPGPKDAGDTGTGSAGTITGTQYGIYAKGVNVNITNETKATITGGESGIYHGGTGTITNSGTITGQKTGVTFTGTGSINNTGSIEGREESGVEILNAAASLTNDSGGSITGMETGVTVVGGSVTNNSGGTIAGAESGITMNYGTVTNTGTIGEVKDSTGAITVASKYGIMMSSSSSTEIAKVTNAYDSATGSAGRITGTQHGIRMGSGKAEVVNSGVIEGLSGAGILMMEGIVDGRIANEAGGTITGGTYGIMSQIDAAITNAGTITGQQTGVTLTGAATATNTGVIEGKKKYGVEMKNSGATLKNQAGGTITGEEVGVYVGAGAFRENAGTVTGGQYGVYYEGANELSNTGTVTATKGTAVMFTGAGTVVNSGTIKGSSTASATEGVTASGIKVTGKADITNSAGGSIAGADSGITMNYGTVTNTGTIGEVKDSTGATTVASKYGILIENFYQDRAASIVNSYNPDPYPPGPGPKDAGDTGTGSAGTITGTQYGIYAKGVNVNITNETKATITGGESGIYHGGTGTITNSGTITGQKTGVTFTGTGSINNTGSIEGREESGVEILNAAASLTNDSGGSITGMETGVTVVGGSVTNNSGGTIAGAESGITMNYGTVTNTGTIGEVKDSTGAITVASKYGVAVNNTSADQTARVTNAYDSATGTGGKITGTIYGIHAEGVNVNVANQAKATITGGESGIYHEGTGTITNAGTITGQQTGVTLTGAATATNTGVIEGKKKYGVEMKNSGATLKNQAGGTITGEEVGVYVGAGAFRENAGTVTGGQYGVYYEGANELSNTGTVTATKGTAVMFTGAGTVVNSGTIKGSSTASAPEGVTASGIKVTGKADITNSAGGSIAGADSGITMNYGTVKNEGTVTGVTGAGIHITGGGTVRNAAGASIRGFTGILSEGDGADVIENSGSIEGTGGMAISTGAGDDTVRLMSGSDVRGNVDMGDGTGDYLLLQQTGSVTGGITGAEEIEKTGMGTWTVDGDVKSGRKISVTGILRTNGTYTHEDGACLIVPVGDMGITGRISAKNAVLGEDGGVYVKLLKAKDTRYQHYFTEGSYTILETDEGVSGEFSRVIRVKDGNDHLTPWLIPSLFHTAKNVTIDIRHLSFDRSQGGSGYGRYAGVQDEGTGVVTENSYPALEMSETQRSLGRYLDTVYDSARNNHDRATILDNVMATMDPQTLVGSDRYLLALDQLSGITHTAAIATGTARQSSFYHSLFGGGARLDGGIVKTGRSQTDSPITIAMDGSSVAIDAAFLPTVNGGKNPVGMWLKGYAVTGNRTGEGIESRYDYTVQGVMGGMDYLFAPHLRAGLAFGYSGVTVDMREVSDTNRQESFQASLYASCVAESKKWYIDGAFSYAWNKYRTERHISVGNLNRVANASYEGAEISGYLESGRRLSLMGFEVTPLVSVLWMRGGTDGFTETDAGSANLSVDSNDTESFQSGVGLKVSRQFDVRPDFFLTPEIGARWFHEFGDTRATLNARFADAPSGSYVITSDTVDRDSGVISLNLQARRHDRLRFSLGYDLGFRRDQTSHAVTGWMRYDW